MIFKSPAMRLSFVLVLLTLNLLFIAYIIGLVPDTTELTLELRKGLSESLAFQFSAAAEHGELQSMQNTLRAVVERNDDIYSAAIRTVDGKLLALAGEHLAHWESPIDGKSTPTQVLVPVYRQGKKWAVVEIRFTSLLTNNWLQGFANSFIGLMLFIGSSSFLCYFFVIKKTLRELDPSAVIPERVQKAFDVLQEGVLILDEKEQILMANKSFAELLGRSPKSLIGLKGSELGWADYQNTTQIGQLPWLNILKDGEEQKVSSLRLLDNLGNEIKLTVTAVIITDNANKCRGSLVTFDDITRLEEKNFELSDLVEQLQSSREEIQVKNEELEFLANRDPMTLCLNRRSMDQQFDILFTRAKREKTQLSCLMVDIDLFKSVNDRFGHSTGDQVIKAVADVLKSCTRDDDLVSRYGGEEFCIVLSGLSLDKGTKIAERIRSDIEKSTCAGVKVTVSLGVSSLEQNAGKPDELISQADKALYAAKAGGRNLVVTWGKNGPSNSAIDVDTEQQPATEVDANSSPIQLVNKIKELEGLLEKRGLEFEHFEMYDIQTGLPTRSLFENRIAHEIAKSKRKDTLVVVLSMYIDTIKRIYETMGHSAAEQLIRACGNRLNDVLREDVDTVAVLEGIEHDSSISLINQAEFGVLLTDINQVDHVTWVLKRLQSAFSKPFMIKKQQIFLNTYIGVSVYPHDGQTTEELYSSAVSACSYVRKMKSDKHYLFASQKINTMATKQLQLENNLYSAIDNNELKLYFQPQVEAATGRISGFEVLLRWKNSQLGQVPPSDFIPVAEQSGQIDRIGDWVLYHACQQLRSWLDEGLTINSIAINLSGIQLQQKNLANRIEEVLKQFNLGAHLLEIELTESSLVNTFDKSFTVLQKIKDLGIRVTMDDFGTGYSSLSYLRDIPLSCVKIDRSFIMDIGKDENAEKLIASIISMAHSLGLQVVAEGVEEQHQADHLSSLGCEYLQGYLFGKPVPEAEVPAFFKVGSDISKTA
ncbi:MAG: EAL domain-containing protein [Deltaproteobacteria bacterium]|nr:EAL domain-containing protein [Deltaproteobacteria bacterium]